MCRVTHGLKKQTPSFTKSITPVFTAQTQPLFLSCFDIQTIISLFSATKLITHLSYPAFLHFSSP